MRYILVDDIMLHHVMLMLAVYLVSITVCGTRHPAVLPGVRVRARTSAMMRLREGRAAGKGDLRNAPRSARVPMLKLSRVGVGVRCEACTDWFIGNADEHYQCSTASIQPPVWWYDR